jgi:hypothetical protein
MNSVSIRSLIRTPHSNWEWFDLEIADSREAGTRRLLSGKQADRATHVRWVALPELVVSCSVG